MNQRALSFGPHGGLVGILTEPSGDERSRTRPAVLFANVGVHHRVGPFRAWVDLARQLAAAGFASLRYDLSGLGESAPRTGAGTELERFCQDFRDAMDRLTQEGYARFVLVGFCSGVDPVHAMARDDSRIAGAAFLDGYVFPTTGYRIRRLLSLRKREVIRRALERRVISLLGRVPEDDGDLYTRRHPTLEQCRADLRTMLARALPLFFLFTSGAQGYNADHQLMEMFPALEGGPVTHSYQPEADHLLSSARDRSIAVRSIADWVTRSFGDGQPGASPRR